MRGQSALDGFNPNVTSSLQGEAVSVMALQPDGKILIGGNFNGTVGGQPRNRIARINPDGTVDIAFNPIATGPQGFGVSAIAVQADGKILVSGSFTSIGGQTRNGFARLDGTTGLADSFDPNPNGGVGTLIVQANGKILVAGSFTSIGGQTRNRVARLDAATGLADSFDPNANDYVYTIVTQADGKLLVAGGFTTIGGQSRNGIARLDATTGLADSFNPNVPGVGTIAVQPDGKILIGGTFISVGGQPRNMIARLNGTTGTPDSFNPNPDMNPFVNYISTLAVQPDGKILVGGTFFSIGGQPRYHIARLDPSTGLADSFDPSPRGAGFMDFLYAILVQPDGKVLLGGAFMNLSPNGGATVPRNRVARVEIDGRLDQTLNLSYRRLTLCCRYRSSTGWQDSHRRRLFTPFWAWCAITLHA